VAAGYNTRVSPLIEEHADEIRALCRKYRLKRLDLFGSAARADFDPQTSDVDFFYEFDDADLGDLADRFFGLQEDLERMLGRRVDLVSSAHVRNKYFLAEANRHRITLYAA
jgi:predicted nucleotidyltransferase